MGRVLDVISGVAASAQVSLLFVPTVFPYLDHVTRDRRRARCGTRRNFPLFDTWRDGDSDETSGFIAHWLSDPPVYQYVSSDWLWAFLRSEATLEVSAMKILVRFSWPQSIYHVWLCPVSALHLL